MKKSILLVLSILFCTTVLSAQKAVMLQDGGSLFTEKDGTMVWAKSIDRGTELDLVSQDVVSSKRTVSKKLVDCQLYNVSYDGKKYYVLTDRVSVSQKPAVIVKDCAVYKTLDIASVKSIHLPKGELVTIGNVTKANNVFNFVEVTYFDDANYTTRTGYILNEKISSKADDLTAIRILKKIRASKDNDVRAELFETADSMNMSVEISQMLTELKEELEKFNYGGEGSVEEKKNFTTVEAVNLYGAPEEWDNVVVSVPQEKTVISTYKTNKTYSVDDEHSYPWYYVTYTDEDKSYDGWVLAVSIKEQEF